MVAVVVEALAMARERVAGRVPFAGPLQSWAHRLVASAALLTSLLGTRPALAAPAPLPPPPPAVAVVDAPSLAPAQAPAPPAEPGESAPAALSTYTVARRDDLWSIAEEHLGDPYRWPEIFKLNVGQPQADGCCLEEPDMIRPGWVLELPADATGLAPAPAAAPPRSASSAEPAPPVEVPELPEAPAGTEDEAPSRTGPLGPVASRGGLQAPAPTTTTVTSAPEAQPQALPRPVPGEALPSGAASAPAPAPPAAPPAPAASAEESGAPTAVVLAGSGLLAAGVVLCLDRLRRVQQRRRRPTRRIRMPEAELVEVERSLRAGADDTGAEVLDVVLRSMAEAAAQLDHGLPDVVSVELDEASLRVVFASPPPSPPQPWEADRGGRLWRLALEDMDLEELQALSGRIPAPLPVLVSLGSRGDSEVLVNLEGTGVTGIVAESPQAWDVLAALALELTTCPRADFVDVVLVGFGHELEWLERARRADTLDDVVADLEHEAYGLAELLEASGWPNVVSARVQGAAADWVPTVVLCATDLDDDVEARLAKLSGEVRHAGVTVVVAGEVPEAQRRIVVDGDAVRVEPLGVAARRERWLAEDQLRAVAALLEVAADTEDVPAPEGDLELFFEAGAEEPAEYAEGWPAGESIDQERADQADAANGEDWAAARDHAAHVLDGLVFEEGPSPEEAPSSEEAVASSNGAKSPSPSIPAAPRRLEPGEVEVRVLGPVEVAGRDPVNRAKSFEAVVYLAMHRSGVDSDKLRWALWPDTPQTKANEGTWNTTGSVARRWLGKAPDGTLLLPRAYHNNGLYRLDEKVSTDYEHFAAEAALAARLDGSAAVGLLHSALERVRGPLFDGAAKWHWVRYEGHEAVLEAQVVDAALRMSELCLETGEIDAATWALHRGQRVSPYDERLYRALMVAADRAGNPAGVESAMEDLCEKVEADVEPYDQVHPETLALYQQLRRSRKTLAGSGRTR